jgi:cytidylate kinase
MTTRATPKETRGQRFAREIAERFDLTLTEQAILDEVAATLDALADSKLGDAARRQHRLILSRLLAQLNLDAADAQRPTFTDGKSRRAQAASLARWGRREASA